MQYTDQGIVRSYNEAKQRNKQISILAELNCCTRQDIIKILENNNIVMPAYYKKDIPKPESEKKTSKKQSGSQKAAEPDSPKEKPCKEKPVKEVKEAQKEVQPDRIKEPVELQWKNRPQADKALVALREDMDLRYKLIIYELAKTDKKIKKITKRLKRLEKLYRDLAYMIMSS